MSADEALWGKSLIEAARSWDDAQRSRGALWRGEALDRALSFAEMDDLEAGFVQESVAECLRRGEGIGADRPTARLIEILFELLADSDFYLCSKAEYALKRAVGTRFGIASSVIDRLLGLLRDPDCTVRPRAARILEETVRVRPERVTDAIVALLVGLLRDRDENVSSVAKYTLKRVADTRPELAGGLAGALEDMLADPCGAVCVRAACILEAVVVVRPEAATPQMVGTLVERLRDSSDGVCRRAQYVLERVIGARPEMVPQIAGRLDALLDDVDAKVCARATRLLEKVVQADSKAATEERVRTLVRLSQERNDEVSRPAGYVLKRIVEILPELAQGAGGRGAGSLAFVVP